MEDGIAVEGLLVAAAEKLGEVDAVGSVADVVTDVVVVGFRHS